MVSLEKDELLFSCLGDASALVLSGTEEGGGVSVSTSTRPLSFLPNNLLDHDTLLLCCRGDSLSSSEDSGGVFVATSTRPSPSGCGGVSAAVEGSFFRVNSVDHDVLLLRCPRDSLSGGGDNSTLPLLSDLGDGGVSVVMAAVEDSFFLENSVDHDALLLCCLGDSLSPSEGGGVSVSTSTSGGGSTLLFLGGGGVSVAMAAVEGSFSENLLDHDALLLCCLGDSPSGGGEGGLSSSSTSVEGGGALLLLGLSSLLSQPT